MLKKREEKASRRTRRKLLICLRKFVQEALRKRSHFGTVKLLHRKKEKSMGIRDSTLTY